MSVFLADEQGEPVDLIQLRHLAELVLSEEAYPDETEVTVLLVSEDEMASYNERFLDRAGPTDVLAFPVEELMPGVVPDPDPAGPPLAHRRRDRRSRVREPSGGGERGRF